MEILSMLILILALILGAAVSAFVFMVLILQSAAHEMQKIIPVNIGSNDTFTITRIQGNLLAYNSHFMEGM
jgi:flagellar basal body-associated protein FliL